MLQESKRKISAPKMKAKNLENYQIFELRREKSKNEGGKGLGGGGLAVGALHDLNPILLRQGNDEVECLTVQVDVGHVKVRCVTGYGPQRDDSTDRKHKFWNFLDQEVLSAKSAGIGLIIEID